MTTGTELVDALADVWDSIDALAGSLSEDEFQRPTDCPGWSVQDNIVHIYAVESMLLGEPMPDHEIADDLEHVKNDFGRINEIWVDSRRARRGAEVRAEFESVTGRRIAVLRTLSEADFDGESWTPVGKGTVRSLLPFRIFDAWAHEQDMRRALDRPGGFTGPAAEMAFARCVGFMPFAIGKKLRPADGTSVVWELTGPLARTVVVEIEGGRGRLSEAPPVDPVVTLTMSTEAFAMLAMGRRDVATIVADAPVAIAGDAEFGARVLDAMNTLF